ncbi:endonuclease domain-containing protein [Streptomyces sp. NPDC002855]|uniref:endonuclease domain-containing protein n=1 Tax=Streptomyces sp. NPDC002855 TaxID=3154437 RepID=UPI003318420B
MEITEKRCAGCGKTKPIEEFALNGRKANGEIKRSAKCKQCGRDAQRDRTEAAKAEGRGRDYAGERIRREAERVGLSHAQYLERVSAPCHICGAASGEGNQRNGVYVNRQTGKVTGTVCLKCSSALGYFSHDAERLRRALDLLGPERSA